MNKQELIELVKVLGDKAGPQLRTYIHIEWCGWFTTVILAWIGLFILARSKKKISDFLMDETAGPLVAIMWAVGAIIHTKIFITYTWHVFTTPEIEALKALFQ